MYADDTNEPTTFYVVHPYGMSLLFGRTDNHRFNIAFKEYALNINHTRSEYEWMQAFPSEWNAVLANLFSGAMISSFDNVPDPKSGIIELNTRINFKFNRARYAAVKDRLSFSNVTIRQTDETAFHQMKGTVVPAAFWDTAEDFCLKGVGFSLYHHGRLASTAYSAFCDDGLLEIGIETIKEYRGQGFARLVCAALIDYCLSHGYEPVWACRLENTGSYELAQRLGFVPLLRIPYYRLSK